MRNLFSWIILVSLSLSGCHTPCVATRTAFLEPLQFCVKRQQCLESRHNRQSADYVWQCIEDNSPCVDYSPDYERGFKAGFADFMELGGTGAPPPIPPRRYWKLKYRTPAGHQAVQDWYAGFRDGAAEARDCSYDRWKKVPSSLVSPIRHNHEIWVD